MVLLVNCNDEAAILTKSLWWYCWSTAMMEQQ